MNVKGKFGVKSDTHVHLMRTFSDSVVTEFDWWMYICVRFTRKNNFIWLFLGIRVKLQFPLVDPIADSF